MRIGEIDIQIGGFHDHWLRNGTDVSSVLMAAVTKYHYDFICLMDREFGESAERIKKQLESWIPGFRVYLGEERMYGWGHIVSVMNDCPNIDLQNEDFFKEMRKQKECGGIVALAHIGHPLSKEKISRAGHLDRLLDEDFVDALQIETDEDWEFLKKRAESGKCLPLISGWDSHMLTPFPEMPNCLYDESCGVGEHFENSQLVRTIVFAPDNSFESIRAALRAGKSVMENIETGKIYGSPKLIKQLEENGYREKMKELDEKYNALNLKSEVLTAGGEMFLKFPKKGKVSAAVNADLKISVTETDDEGGFNYRNIPMPVELDESCLPIMLDDGDFKRFWAIKVKNDINIDVSPDIKDEKRVLVLTAKRPFCGKIVFDEPYSAEYSVNGKENEILCELELGDDIEKIFNYSFVAEKENGRKRHYKKHEAIVRVPKWRGSWEDAEKISVDDARFCGGFGSFRAYPGPEVFSFRVKMLWDEKYFYIQYDINDKIYIPPKPGEFMYLSDSTFLSLDALFTKANNPDPAGGMTLGFPTEKGVIYVANPKYPDGTHYFDRGPEFVSESETHMQTTDYGRIVTAKIPWKELSPIPVKEGMRMGFAVSAVNNEGAGLVDNMRWPWPDGGTWSFPSDWGVLKLTDKV